MKNTWLLLWLLAAYSNVLAQTGFNIAPDLGYHQVDIEDMIVHNDTIVCYGIARYKTGNLWKQDVLVAQFDTNGTLVKKTLIPDTLGDLMATGDFWGKIIGTSDGGYAMTAATVYRESAFLIKLSHDLDIEFITEFPDTVNRANYRYKVFEFADHYFVYGCIQRQNYLNNAFLRKVDKHGNTVWFKYLSDYNLDFVMHHADVRHDSTFVFFGGGEYAPEVDSAIIIITDTAGNVIKRHQHDVRQLQTNYWGMATPDGGFLVNGVKVFPSPLTSLQVMPSFAQFDSNFNLIWVRLFGQKININAGGFFYKVTERHGYLLGAGQNVISKPIVPASRIGGWVQKFTLEGDSIWLREALAPVSPDLLGNWHTFYAADALSSGSVIAAGSAIADGPKSYLWILKLSPDGCIDTFYCDPTILFAPSPPQDNTLKMRVFPNPATDFAHVELPEGAREPLVQVFDLQGREVQGLQVRDIKPSIQLNLAGVSAGLYFVAVSEKGRVLAREKLVVAE